MYTLQWITATLAVHRRGSNTFANSSRVSKGVAILVAINSYMLLYAFWISTTAFRTQLMVFVCTTLHIKRQLSKGKFLYNAVSCPQDRSKCFTLYFPDRPVHSDATLTTINAEGCSYTYPPLSIARYSFIQLSELEQCRVKTTLTPQHRIRTRVLEVESPKLYP